MPEMPEVETVRKSLEKCILGKTISEIIINYPKIIKLDDFEFTKRMTNQTIQRVDRYAKYLMFITEDETMLSHLRMEGKYYFYENEPIIEKHDHIIFAFTDNTFLVYRDVRKFGTMELISHEHPFENSPLSKLGPEVTNIEEFTAKYLKNEVNKKMKTIKAILLDQSIVSGLGNIYVDETLYQAKIHPAREGKSLTIKECEVIVKSAIMIIENAIKAGGTTIKSFQVTPDITGRFQQQLNVYQQKDEPCPRCLTPIIKIKVAQRGTYLCPKCQKL